MRLKTKLVKDGNSWALRVPKAALKLSGLRPSAELDLEVRPGRLILRLPKQTANDRINQAHKDFKLVWEEALDDVWFQVFGPDDDSAQI